MTAANATSGARFRVFIISALAALSLGLVAMPAIANAAAPVASDVFAGTNDVTPVVITFNATDGDAPPVTYSIVTPPAGGSLGTVTNTPPNSGSVTYTANADFAGIDSFTYEATNIDGSSQATASVVVRPDTSIDTGPSGLTNNDAPTFSFSSPQTGTVFECRIDSDAFAPCTSPFTADTLSDGAHTFEVRARAGLGGPLDATPASRSFTVDATAPSVVLEQAAGQDDPTNNPAIEFTLSANEPLNPATVDASDFDVTNGTIDSVTGAGDTYTVTVTPDADGAVGIEPSGTFSVEDVAGNAQATADGADRSVTYDGTAPTVTLEQAPGQVDPTNVSSIEFILSADEDLAGASIENSDFAVTNGTIDSINGSGDTWTVTVTADGDGDVTIAPSGTFEVEDLVGNVQASALGADRSVTYDTIAPNVDIDKAVGQDDPTTSTAIEFTLSSDENLAAATVTAADFEATNATIDSVTGSGDEYTIAVTASAEGIVELNASGDFSVEDIAGNAQTTATTTDNSVLYDTPPDLTLEQAGTQDDPTNNPAIEFTLSADEPLNPATVDASDFDISNGTIDSVTGAADTYTIAVTAAADDDYTISPSATFEVEDLLGNPETEIVGGTDRTVTYDGTDPVTTIETNPTNPSRDATPTFTFSADEAVTGFECSLVPDADPSDFQPCTSPLTSSLLTPGDYRFEVRSSDPAGNDGAADSFTWTIQPSAITGAPEQATYFTRGGNPVEITIVATDDQPGDLSYSLQDSTEGGTLGTFDVAPGGGSAMYTSANGFAGTETLTVRVRNTATNAFTDINADVVVRPATRLISGPGVGLTNPNSNDATPTFAFDAVSGPDDGVISGLGFSCSLDGVLQPTLACASGTFTPAAPLSEGPHEFVVTASKPILNQDNQPQVVQFTVDTIAPDAPGLTGTEGLINSNDLSYEVTLPEGSAECRLIGPGDPDPAWNDQDCDGTVEFTGVADGDYTFEVRTVDAAENRSPISSLSATVDTVVTVTIDVAPVDGNADARPTIEFSSDEDPNVDYTCRLFPAAAAPEDQPAFEACSSPVQLPFLDTNVRHRFEVMGVDPAGNETVTAVEWDQTNNAPVVPAPDVTVEAGEDVVIPLGSTDDDSDPLTYSITTDPVLGGTLGDIDQGTGDVTFSAANDSVGAYTVDFEVTDQREGGTVAGVATVRVQPQTVFVTEPPAETNNVLPTWTFESPSGVTTFECRLDGVDPWEACDGGSYTPASDLAEGLHTLEVRAISGALTDPTPSLSEIEVDLTAPDVSIDATPVALSNDTTPAFEFSSTDPSATFECSIDGGDFAACVSGENVAELPDGMRNFAVRAVDPATNIGTEATYDWEVDATEPVINLGGQPEGVKNGPGDGQQTNARRPIWHFERSDLNLDEASVRCYIDSGTPLTNCLSPFQPSTNLSDGLHTLHIEVDDFAGNTGEFVAEFRVNTLAPSATFTEVPASPSAGDVTFEFTSSVDLGPEGSFACRTSVNGGSFGAWSACSSPLSLTGLSSATRTLQVKAIDSAGNESTGGQVASHTWTTIGGSPDTTITGSTKNGGSASFAFSSPGNPLATFECSLDGAAFTACTSPRTYTGLSVAEHEFRVRAVNTVGTVDPTPAVHVWTVGAPVEPDTSITGQPPARTSSPAASFSFVSSESVATFECRLDGGAFEACESPKSYTGLAEGEHTFEVRSTSIGGLADQSPASYTWTIAPPEVEPLPAEIGPPVIRAPKAVKSGKAVKVSAVLSNNGDESAKAKVCLNAPKKLIRGKARRCRTVTVNGGSVATAKFSVGTKPRKKGAALRMRVTVEYSSSGSTKREFKGHVTLMK